MTLLNRLSHIFWSPRAKRLYLTVITTLMGFVFLLKADQSLRITHIKIQKPSSLSSVLGLEQYQYKNILFISPESMQKDLRKRNPYIKKIEVFKEYPNTLKLAIEIYTPLVNLRANNGYFIVGENGAILEKRKQPLTYLPDINYYQAFDYYSSDPGDKITFKDIISSIELLKTAIDLELKIDTIDIKGTNMIAFILEGSEILLSAEKSIDEQQYELEYLIPRLKLEGKKFKRLDLRFDKPIIKLS